MLYPSMLRWIDNGQTNDIHIILEYIDNEHFLIKNEHTMQYLSAHENNVDVFWTSKFFVPVTLYEVFRSTSGFVTTLNGRWIRTNENGFCQVNPDQCISTLKIEEYVSIVCQTTNQDVICISDDDSDSDLPPPTNTGTTSLPPPPPTNTGTTSYHHRLRPTRALRRYHHRLRPTRTLRRYHHRLRSTRALRRYHHRLRPTRALRRYHLLRLRSTRTLRRYHLRGLHSWKQSQTMR